MFLRNPRSSVAFTLLEMLVVIVVVALLTALTVPVFTSLLGAQDVSRSIYDMASVLETARNEAVSRQTYVWVGVQADASNGEPELVAGTVYSRDGSGTNTNGANLMPTGKNTRFRHIVLAAWTDLNAGTRNLLGGKDAPASLAGNGAGITFNVSGVSFQQTLTFTPRGEAMLAGGVLPDAGFNPLIDVSFRQAQGGVAKTGANDASVIVEGSTGLIRVLRIP